MQDYHRAVVLITRDLILAGFTGGLATGLLLGEKFGASWLAACLWLALSFVLLGWLLALITSELKLRKLFIFLLACAKIPASYGLLYLLFAAGWFDDVGLAAGLAVLPAVLLIRGIALGSSGDARSRRSPDHNQVAEEG